MATTRRHYQSSSAFQTTAHNVDSTVAPQLSDKLIVVVGINSSSVIPTVTQRTTSNTVIQTLTRVHDAPAGGQSLYAYEADVSTLGSRITASAPSPFNLDVHVWIYPNMKSGISFDKGAATTGASGLSRSTGNTITLAQTDQVGIVAMYMNGNFTVSATPWNNGYSLAGTTQRVFTGQKDLPTAASTGATGTLSSTTARYMHGLVATFRVETSNLFTDSDTVALAEDPGPPEISLSSPESVALDEPAPELEEDEEEPSVFEFDDDELIAEIELAEDSSITKIFSATETLLVAEGLESTDFTNDNTDTDTILLTDSEGVVAYLYMPTPVDQYPNRVSRLDPTWRPLQDLLLRHFQNPTRGRNIFLLLDGTTTDIKPQNPALIARIFHAGHAHVVSAEEYEALRVGGFT